MLITSNNLLEVVTDIKKFVNTNTALLFIGEESGIDIDKLIVNLNSEDIQFIGGIFPQVVYDNEAYKKGIVVSVLYGVDYIATIKDIRKKEFSIPKYTFDNDQDYCLLTLVDGLTSNISNYLSNLYEVYGMKTNYFGGGAGSLSLQQAPCILSKEGFFEDTAVFCIAKTTSNIGVKHGWQKLEGPYIVTKAVDNTVEEINWDTPYNIYKDIVEKDSNKTFNGTNFFDLAKGYPLGIIKQGVDHIIRDPLSVKDQKALVCIGEVEENTMINIMKGNSNSLIKAAKEVAEESIKNTNNPKNAIIIDCISRVLYLEDDFNQELENISEAIHSKHPDIKLTGALTLGEISSYGNGYIEFYNKTIVVGLFE